MKPSRIVSMFLLVFAIAFAGCDKDESSPPQDTTPRVFLSPSDMSISMSEAAEFELLAENISDSVFAISLVIEYSRSILNFNGYTTSDNDVFGPNAVEFVQQNGGVYVAFSLTNALPSIYPNGRICSLEFLPQSTGQAGLTISVASLIFYDRSGAEVTIEGLEAGNASVSVN